MREAIRRLIERALAGRRLARSTSREAASKASRMAARELEPLGDRSSRWRSAIDVSECSFVVQRNFARCAAINRKPRAKPAINSHYAQWPQLSKISPGIHTGDKPCNA